MAAMMSGTIKRTETGHLVAEVDWQGGQLPYRVRVGQEITVGDTTAKILAIGDSFKRGGCRYAYLYLEDAVPVAATSRRSAAAYRDDDDDDFGHEAGVGIGEGG